MVRLYPVLNSKCNGDFEIGPYYLNKVQGFSLFFGNFDILKKDKKVEQVSLKMVCLFFPSKHTSAVHIYYTTYLASTFYSLITCIQVTVTSAI